MTDTALTVANVANFTNLGGDVSWDHPGFDPIAGVDYGEFGADLNYVPTPQIISPRDFNSVAQIITFIDPITGLARLAFATDEGITSYVPQHNGDVLELNGFTQDFQVQDVSYLQTDVQVSGKRNGNLQVARCIPAIFSRVCWQPALLNRSPTAPQGAGRHPGFAGRSDWRRHCLG